jgi:hypothetical protein
MRNGLRVGNYNCTRAHHIWYAIHGTIFFCPALVYITRVRGVVDVPAETEEIAFVRRASQWPGLVAVQIRREDIVDKIARPQQSENVVETDFTDKHSNYRWLNWCLSQLVVLIPLEVRRIMSLGVFERIEIPSLNVSSWKPRRFLKCLNKSGRSKCCIRSNY